MILLRGLAQYMRRQGILAWSPPPHAATPRYLPHIFTPAELAALFAAIDACSVDPRSPYRHWIFPVLFRLLYGTGIRISEALALTYHDFDSKAGMIHIRHGKGDKERRIPLHATLVARLEDYVARFPSHDPDGPLFPNPRSKAYTTSAIYGAFRRFLWAAGISRGGRGKGPRFHDVRYPNLNKIPTFFPKRCDSRFSTRKGSDFFLALYALLIEREGGQWNEVVPDKRPVRPWGIMH